MHVPYGVWLKGNKLEWLYKNFYPFNKINNSITPKIYDSYSYFLKRISNTKKFNLDEESLFMEFKQKILNG